MKKKSPLSVFTGGQGKMYAALIIMWQNYLSKQDAFSQFNKKYTKELGIEQQELVIAARSIPDVTVRREIPVETRNQLARAANNCTDNWQVLASIIEDSYPKSEVKSKKILAGSENYHGAANKLWDKVVSLTDAGLNFTNDNLEVLLAGGMLPEFPETFAANKKTFDDLYTVYYGTKQNFNNQTTNKANANNQAFTAAINMARDGKKIYKNDPRTRAMFTYSEVMKQVKGDNSKCGCRFVLQQKDLLTPVLGANITFIPTGKSFNSNEKGIVLCELPAGKYKYTIVTPDFVTAQGSLTVKSGTMHRQKIILQPAAARAENITSTTTKTFE